MKVHNGMYDPGGGWSTPAVICSIPPHQAVQLRDGLKTLTKGNLNTSEIVLTFLKQLDDTLKEEGFDDNDK